MKKLFLKILIFVTLISVTSCAKNNKDLCYAGTLDGIKVQIPALTGGKIIDLLVEEGQLVQKGDTIAVIDTEDLQYQLQQIQASLSAISANEAMAKTNISQSVKDMKYIDEKFQRTKQLYQTQSVSQQALDDIANQKEKLSSVYLNSTENLKQIQGNKKQLDTQIASIQKKIRDANIKSPLTGTVTNRYYEEGEAIPPMGSIVQIVDTRELSVKIYVSVNLLQSMKMGQEVSIRAEGTNKEFKGNIQWISTVAEFTPKNVLTPETRSSLVYAVKIRVMNPDGELKQGMPVEMKFPRPEA